MTSRWSAFALGALMIYFAFHALAGEGGLGHWSDIQAEARDKRAELKALEADIARLQNDIARLTPGQVDPDFIEALARERLAFVYPDEYILITNDDLDSGMQ